MSSEPANGRARGRRVRVPKTAELVAAELRRRIIRGELKEGDSLPPESILIDEFGISRPTMREAFRILETEKLISVSRGSRGGARVHRPDVDVVARYAGLYLQSRSTILADVFEARRLIEPPAARLLAERRPAATIRELHEMLTEVEANIEDPEAYAVHAARFHLKVIEGSRNETLTLFAHVVHQILEASLLRANRDRYVVELAKKGLRSEHKLLKLIEAGDGPGAEQHVLAHIDAAARIILKTQGSKSLVEVLS
ncbi:MAG TPA: FCD domain-containing protein [Pseudomonadales bacterium]